MNPFGAEEWHEVDSSMIKAVGTLDGDLIVLFRNDDAYCYPGLAHEVIQLLSTDSVGKYFHKEIRDQHCTRLQRELSDG